VSVVHVYFTNDAIDSGPGEVRGSGSNFRSARPRFFTARLTVYYTITFNIRARLTERVRILAIAVLVTHESFSSSRSIRLKQKTKNEYEFYRGLKIVCRANTE